MEINLEAISTFLGKNRLADGEKLIQLNGREIGFKPTGSDSIGGKFLGWRSEEQQTVNNQVRDLFLKFVLKQFDAKDASRLPEGVKKAMELNDYCGLFGSVRSLTARGGTSTGKPLSLRRIRTVVRAIKDCRERAVSRLDQAIARLRALGSSPETIRELAPNSHETVTYWTETSVAALEAVRDAIANGAPQEEVGEAIKRLHAFTNTHKRVAKQRREIAREKEQRWELDEADQYDILADFAKKELEVLVGRLKELKGLYNVSTEKRVPRKVYRGSRERAVKRDTTGNYCKAIKALNGFRYSGQIGDQAAGRYEFGGAMRGTEGRKELLLGALKKVIGLGDGPGLNAEKRLSDVQEENRQAVLTEEDFEKDDVKPLRISDNQVPIPECTVTAQDGEEAAQRLDAVDETVKQAEKMLDRRLDEKVGQHLMKVGAMDEKELERQFEEVPVPGEMAEAFSALHPDGKMTVLERDLVADILKDYGISIPGA